MAVEGSWGQLPGDSGRRHHLLLPGSAAHPLPSSRSRDTTYHVVFCAHRPALPKRASPGTKDSRSDREKGRGCTWNGRQLRPTNFGFISCSPSCRPAHVVHQTRHHIGVTANLRTEDGQGRKQIQTAGGDGHGQGHGAHASAGYRPCSTAMRAPSARQRRKPAAVGRGSGMRTAIWPARMRPARVTGVTRWTRIMVTSTSAVIAPLSAAANGCSCPPRTESSR